MGFFKSAVGKVRSIIKGDKINPIAMNLSYIFLKINVPVVITRPQLELEQATMRPGILRP